jgi:L-ascorbate metabolism protein UlaG (beta-lactamase superfamily)
MCCRRRFRPWVLLLGLAVLLRAEPSPRAAGAPVVGKLTWYGQSCFLLETAAGTRDVSIRSVGVYHDDKRGAVRGLDTVFIFEVGGLRIAHLGDLGHVLDDDQLEAIGSVDVLLVPVGGATTLDAYQATRVIDQLHPRLMIIPMHYKTDALDLFLERKANVRREAQPTVVVTSVKARPATEIVVLPDR